MVKITIIFNNFFAISVSQTFKVTFTKNFTIMKIPVPFDLLLNFGNRIRMRLAKQKQSVKSFFRIALTYKQKPLVIVITFYLVIILSDIHCNL